ncbi:MAG: hypothetical protein HQ591_02030 [candidate division Zixibacteria bacterium]|nr:hypothetical protein [Candidatus Tariuqbacter arcticus]
MQGYRIHIVLILFITVLPAIVFSGSIFSSSGIGLVSHNPGGREAGMGILGIGLADSGAVGSLNPALWAGTNITRFSGGLGMTRFSSKDEFTDDLSDDFNLRFLALGICLKPGLTLGFRFYPQSRIDYRWTVNKWLGDLKYEDFYIGKGGVTISSMILAGRLSPKIWAGGGVDMIFGNLSTLWGVNFVSAYIADSEFTLSDQLFGLMPRIGFHYAIDDKSALGIFAAAGTDVGVTEEYDYSYSDSTSSVDRNLRFPPVVGAGYSFPISSRVKGSIDFLWMGWKRDNQDIGEASRLQQSQFLGFGMEVSPLEEPLAAFIQRLAYRAGINYRNLYYQYPNGQTVGEFSLSLGLGIPLKKSDGRLDFAFTLGKRGDLEVNNAEEFYFNFGLYINTGEKWFVRKKRY